MRVLAGVLSLTLAASIAFPAGRIPVLVELFTSEGCSSCPPADALLAALDRTQPVAGADAIVLSEHVDYWNQLGWTDPYSSPAFSRRQQEYGTRFKLPSIYTPEMVIDGRVEFTGNDAARASQEIQKATQQEKAQVTLSQPIRNGRQIRVHVEVASLPGGAKASAIVYVALAEERALSHVTKGENEGRALQHVAVVRSLTQAGIAKGAGKFAAEITLTAPASATSGLRVIAFVQEKNSRHVLGAAQQRL